MTMISYEDTAHPSFNFEDAAEAPTELGDHARTYRKFVHSMQALAFAAPIMLAFVLYWTT